MDSNKTTLLAVYGGINYEELFETMMLFVDQLDADFKVRSMTIDTKRCLISVNDNFVVFEFLCDRMIPKMDGRRYDGAFGFPIYLYVKYIKSRLNAGYVTGDRSGGALDHFEKLRKENKDD